SAASASAPAAEPPAAPAESHAAVEEAAAEAAVPAATSPAAAPAAAAPAATTTAPAGSTASGSDTTTGPGTLIRAENLLAKAASDAAVVAPLAANSAVTILGREGGWYQVKTADGKTGWVRMLSVRRSTATASTSAGLASVASGRTG